MAPQYTRPITPRTRSLSLPQVEVKVTAGPDKGKSARLGRDSMLIGTDAGCDLVLSDDTVSGRHCELRRQADVVLLEDLGSTNGVELGGARILSAIVEPGVRLRVGETELTLKSVGKEEVALSATSSFGGLHGASAAMRILFAQLEAIAATDGTLLVEGETGTGKERVAQAVHHASKRKDGPFVVFDCSATAATLIEAELFGHEKGAFTGATTAREGLAAAASGGTLVLDEVGELPLELQPKLLRLLEAREVRPVGSNQPQPVDVRIIACTHRALEAEVKAGRFRGDLFYRLSALRARVPALRERLDDLALLVDQLFSTAGSDRRFVELPEHDRALLLSHDWPGNVRELRNVMERLVAFPHAPARGLLDSFGSGGTETSAVSLEWTAARERALETFEQTYLQALLAEVQGSISEAARVAGVSRQFMQRVLRKYSLR